MKKGGLKASGVITLIVYLLLALLTIFNVLTLFVEPVKNIATSVDILAGILTVVGYVFVGFPLTLVNLIASLDASLIDTLNMVLSIVAAVFCVYMVFWGIKEISLGKKDDERVAKCKKTCVFMHIIKFMLFVYFAAVAACCFVLPTVKETADNLAQALGVPMILVIVAGVLALISLLVFILAVACINKVAKAVKNGTAPAGDNAEQQPADGSQDPNAAGQAYDPAAYDQSAYQGYDQSAYQGYDPNAYYDQSAYDQSAYAQQYQQPYAQQQYSQPAAQPAQPAVQPAQQTAAQPAAQPIPGGTIVPGQNGVPANITQKGLQDLERLERLKQSGAITEANYIAMRIKICNSNLA